MINTLFKIIILLVSVMVANTETMKADGEVQRMPNIVGLEVTCSLQDEEGYWWYGGRDTGLCRFDGYDTEAFRSDRQHPHLLRSNDIQCMTEQRANAEIWFGTKEGAYILCKRNYQVRPIVLKTGNGDNELADKRINCMLTAADGSVWMSYRNQLLHLSAKAMLLERFETVWEGKNRSVSRVCFDKDGNLFAELWNGGIVCLKKENGKWKLEDTPLKNLEMVDGYRQATAEEVNQRLDSVMARQAPKNDVKVLSWARGSREDEFFIGSYHSIYLYDGQNIKQLQTGLDKVRSMAYSKRLNTLFLLSKTPGICQWKDQRLTVLCDSSQFRHLQLVGDTALLLSDGLTGVSKLNLRTHKLTADTTTSDVKPIATAYVLDGKKQPMAYGTQTLSLPSGVDIVEILLSSLDYDHVSQIQFAYRIDNDEWVVLPEGENMAKFAHLPGGSHQLQVRATDAYGRWSIPTTVLTIECPMPWYGHIWLWGALLIVIVGAGYFYYKKRKAERQETSSTVLQEDILDETAADTVTVLSVADQDFIDKAAAAVSANMVNSDYSVDALASDLCMSRANLYRKMRSITGQTPTDFIRNQRLERAAQLLRTTSHTVNEIADLVGFSYASYFTKCFKDKYGVLPKDY